MHCTFEDTGSLLIPGRIWDCISSWSLPSFFTLFEKFSCHEDLLSILNPWTWDDTLAKRLSYDMYNVNTGYEGHRRIPPSQKLEMSKSKLCRKFQTKQYHLELINSNPNVMGEEKYLRSWPGWGSNPRPSAKKSNTLPRRYKRWFVPQGRKRIQITNYAHSTSKWFLETSNSFTSTSLNARLLLNIIFAYDIYLVYV